MRTYIYTSESEMSKNVKQNVEKWAYGKYLIFCSYIQSFGLQSKLIEMNSNKFI